MNIAYVCYQELNKGINGVANYEDSELSAFLQAKGLSITTVVWHDKTVNWQDFQAVVLKSPWDYHEHISEFNQWLDKLSALGVKVLNPANAVKWNGNKRYLAEIADAGLPIIDTVYLTQGDKLDEDSDLFKQLATDKIVIKPCVSAGAHNTFVVKQAEFAEYAQRINTLLLAGDYMAQPFVDEIVNEGEWSFLFFGGQFSHSVLKRPKSGDFRVQHVHGGSIEHLDVGKEIIDQVTPYVAQFAQNTLYARVDGIIRDGKFSLMELELIEPFLYLGNQAANMENYYQALSALLTNEAKIN